MKKLLPLFLLTVLLFNISGYFAAFELSEYYMEEEAERKIKKLIPENNLVKISFTASQLHELEWEEKGREFRYKGKLYDVVKQTETGGNLVFYCINDGQEDALMAAFAELLERQASPEPGETELLPEEWDNDYLFTSALLQFPAALRRFAVAMKQHQLPEGFFSENLQPPERA